MAFLDFLPIIGGALSSVWNTVTGQSQSKGLMKYQSELNQQAVDVQNRYNSPIAQMERLRQSFVLLASILILYMEMVLKVIKVVHRMLVLLIVHKMPISVLRKLLVTFLKNVKLKMKQELQVRLNKSCLLTSF